MVSIIEDVVSEGFVSAYIRAPFDEAKELLKSEGYRIISLEENAGLRMRFPNNESVVRFGNFVREAVIYVPGEGFFLTKNSPILDNPSEFVERERSREEFYLTDEQVRRSLEVAVRISERSIPAMRFEEDSLASFAFGSNAKNYGYYFVFHDRGSVPIFLDRPQKKPFVRPIWLRPFEEEDHSYINIKQPISGVFNRIRGIKEI